MRVSVSGVCVSTRVLGHSVIEGRYVQNWPRVIEVIPSKSNAERRCRIISAPVLSVMKCLYSIGISLYLMTKVIETFQV